MAVTAADLQALDHVVLRQRIKLVINQYEFHAADAEGAEDEAFAFVEQKRFTFKEDIRFFTDASKREELLRIKARQRFDPRATYDVTLPDGAPVGAIRKVFGKSLLRSTYELLDRDGQVVCQVRERSMPVALFRRLIGFVPYLDSVADWLPIPYDFVFLRDDEVLAVHRRRRWQWRDTYDIDLSADAGRVLDRRLVLAIAVGMDALQAR